MYTYAEYMAESKIDTITGHYCGWLGNAAHRKLYAQLVTPEIIDYVARTIGRAALMASCDPHFNDIPLQKWDALSRIINSSLAQAIGVNLSLSTFTYLHKEAARQWVEANTQVKRFRASRDCETHSIHDFAVGLDEKEALENFITQNPLYSRHKLYGLEGI